MKLYTKIIAIYKFDELNIDARTRAIEDHRQFLLSIMQPEDFITGWPEYDTKEELQKSYDAEYEYYSLNDDPIIENLECNDYNFDETGRIVTPTELLSMTERN